jgi:hypothetical protein
VENAKHLHTLLHQAQAHPSIGAAGGFFLTATSAALLDCHRLIEALQLQIVHKIVGVEGRHVAGGALPFPEEDILAMHLGRARLRALGTKLTQQEKQDLVLFLRAL